MNDVQVFDRDNGVGRRWLAAFGAKPTRSRVQWNGLIGEAAVEKMPKAVHTKKPGNFALAIIKDAKEFEAFSGAGAVNTKIDVDWDKQFLAVVILKENTNRLKFKDISAKDKGLVLTFEWDLIEPAYKGRNPAVMASFDKKDVAFVRFVADGHKDDLGEIKLAGDKEPAGHDAEMKASIHKADGLKWQDGPSSLPPGSKIAVLEGDPSKEGPWVFRLKFPDGYKIPPHTHPGPERVTVISGTLNLGMGEKFDMTKGQEMTAGSVWHLAGGYEALCVDQGRNRDPAPRRRPSGKSSISMRSDDPRKKK